MSEWSLNQLLAGLHDEIEQRLAIARKSLGHPGTKGDASENVWLELLGKYLPARYSVAKAHVVDSLGEFSDQIDVVVFDHQYTPFIFTFEGQTVIPAEGVYAAFEAKQSLDSSQVAYAQARVASVRKLHRTSLPIPHAGGTYPAKEPGRILGGLLTFESDWNPKMGEPLLAALAKDVAQGQLDIGCVAASGVFQLDENGYLIHEGRKPATAFLLELITRLQMAATAPMIDVRAYAAWLDK